MEQKDTIAGFKVFDNPQDLAASMNAPQETTTDEAPQQESQPVQEDVQSESTAEVQPEPNVEAQPESMPVTEEQPQINTTEEVDSFQENIVEYSDSDIEGAVFNYLSERLGRDIDSLDSLSMPQQNALDERVEAIAKFVEETGRTPQDWFAYQQLNTSEMDDATAIRVNMAGEHPDLTREELNLLIGSKYKLDPDVHTEQEIKLSQLQMKIDAQEAKEKIERLRESYKAPEVIEQNAEAFIDDEWISEMSNEVLDMEGLEFDLGNGKNFMFGIDDDYKSELIEKNSQLENYFDPYIRQDGSWDYDKLSSHRTVVDNIDKIVSSAYRQGMSDGQKGIVSNAANISSGTPQQAPQSENPLQSQMKNILRGNNSKLTFKI
mgnify:CR=1 FL=1